MKKLFVGILMAVLVMGCAGMQPTQESKIERIVEVQGHEKNYLFDHIRMWVAENFRSAKEVIEYTNKENGTIIGNGTIKYPCKGIECIAKSDWKLSFTMKVEVKDNKFRITFTNLKLSWPPSYNKTFGYSSGKEVPVRTKSDFNAIAPILLGFGDEIKSYIEGNQNKKDW